MLKPGDRLGAYEIVAQLKRGGMATLYLAQRTGAAGFAKQAAVKVVHPHLADDPSFVQMFLDEARLSARIEHPNVVHVYELGEGEDGMYYLVMEYVNGCSLAQLLRALSRSGRKLAPELATWIAMRVAAGLHAAHELAGPEGERLGVVHRDVSPQNILLAHRGYVKLIDFGIAKARGRSHQTSTGLVKGKFRYMAPEQAASQPVDARTDVYALGVVLWEMLTMRRLFQADDELLLLEQIRKPQVRPPSEVSPDLPAALDGVVMGALAPDPDARFPSAHAFQQALARALPGAPALDAPDLAGLLAAVLPEGEAEAGGAVAPPHRLSPDSSGGRAHAVDDALRTMTVELADGALADAGETPTSGEAQPASPSEGTSPGGARPARHDGVGSGHGGVGSGPASPEEAPTRALSTKPEAVPPGHGLPAHRRPLVQWAGALLALVLVVASLWALALAGGDQAAHELDAAVVGEPADDTAAKGPAASSPLTDEGTPLDPAPPEHDDTEAPDVPQPLDVAASSPPGDPTSKGRTEEAAPAAASPPADEARATQPPSRPKKRPRPRRSRPPRADDDGTIDGMPFVDELDI